MKQIKLFATILLYALSLSAVDQKVDTALLDIIIPENGFSKYLSLIKPRDTPQPSTATADAPKTWVDSANAFFRYLNKNYTETGKLQYVTDPDNPQFLRMIAQHIMDNTPLETKIGELTLEQQLIRVTERSTKAQQEIADTLRKVDAYRVPTHEGAKTMLHIIDSCYLALPNMHLIMAKNYLSLYIKTYKEETLLNTNVLKELKFIPSLIAAHKQIMPDANQKFASTPATPGPQTHVVYSYATPTQPPKLSSSNSAEQTPTPTSSIPSPPPPRSAPIAIPNSGTISRRRAPIPAPQTPATAETASSLTNYNYNSSYNAENKTPTDANIGTSMTPVGSIPHNIERAHLLTRNPSSERRERMRAQQMATVLTAANLQPNYIALEPQEIELGTTLIAPLTALDRQPLHAAIAEQSSLKVEPQSSE